MVYISPWHASVENPGHLQHDFHLIVFGALELVFLSPPSGLVQTKRAEKQRLAIPVLFAPPKMKSHEQDSFA